MNTGLKSRCKAIFHETGVRQEKNGLHRSPINDDLASANTWGTPQYSRFTGRSCHHDA
jgi:hypothetical protein